MSKIAIASAIAVSKKQDADLTSLFDFEYGEVEGDSWGLELSVKKAKPESGKYKSNALKLVNTSTKAKLGRKYVYKR